MSNIENQWHECANGDCQCGQVLGPNSEYICTVKDPSVRRRILACVNACAGVKTKILEDGMCVKVVHSELLRNMGERYQLLVALEDIYQIASSSHMTNNMMLIREKCADAMASIKGGEA